MLQLMDFDPICQYHARLTEILETFPRVFCFPKSRIHENGGNETEKNIKKKNLFREMPVAGYGKLSTTFHFHRRLKTANLIDNEIHLTAAIIFISKHFSFLRFCDSDKDCNFQAFCDTAKNILRFCDSGKERK